MHDFETKNNKSVAYWNVLEDRGRWAGRKRDGSDPSYCSPGVGVVRLILEPVDRLDRRSGPDVTLQADVRLAQLGFSGITLDEWTISTTSEKHSVVKITIAHRYELTTSFQASWRRRPCRGGVNKFPHNVLISQHCFLVQRGVLLQDRLWLSCTMLERDAATRNDAKA